MPNIIDLLHMLEFKNLGKKRNRHIALSSSGKIKKDFKINNMAKSLHPDITEVVVKEVLPSGKDCLLLTLERKDGKAFPLFRAGQYVNLCWAGKDFYSSRPYSICSSPKDAMNGILRVMVKRVPGGRFSTFVHENVEAETYSFGMTGPFGDFTHDDCRDNYDVIALAGGSGITPFLSMARAISEGDEDFNLTILYGARDRDSMCLYEDLKRISETEDRVKLVPVLSDEERKGFESGFITREMIEKYIPTDIDGEKLPVSVYVCGPEAMYKAMEPILMEMGFEKKDVRFECAPGERPERPDEKVDITIKNGLETFTVYGNKNETILMALERAEVHNSSRCRSGSCGFCRGRLIKGDVVTPPEMDDKPRLNHNGFDHRRYSDKEMGIVHLCVTYPDSDIEIEVIGNYENFGYNQ